MKYLGMVAALFTFAAIILNVIWFGRHGLPVGSLLAISWPAAVGLVVLVAAVIGLGYVSVKLLTQAETRDQDED